MSKTAISITASVEAGSASVMINSNISEHEGNSNAATVRGIVDNIISQGITHADVYVNCKGGDAFEATEIDSQLERLTSVTFHIGSIAASAATYLTSNPKFKVKCKYNSQLMVHRPSSSAVGDISKMHSQIKLLENVTNQYKTRYAAKTGMTENEIDRLWSAGDYWMSASDAYSKGFVDEVVEANVSEATEEGIAAITANSSSIPVSRNDWTLEDYLEKDPEALQVIANTNTALFNKLNGDYYMGSPNENNNKPGTESLNASVGTEAIRANWGIDNYLNNDPEALQVIANAYPEIFQRMNYEYFGTGQ